MYNAGFSGNGYFTARAGILICVLFIVAAIARMAGTVDRM